MFHSLSTRPYRSRSVIGSAFVVAAALIATTAAATHATSSVASVASADPSGQPMPVGDLNGWRQVFTDDFSTNVPLGSFPSAVSSTWGAYPAPWKDSSGNGTYSPGSVVSVANGVLTKHIHTENAVAMVAALTPKVPGSAKHGQMFGRYAARFKLDPLIGYKVAWMLWPDSGKQTDGEIDFPEKNLSSPTVWGFVHHQGATSGADQTWAKAGYDAATWHTAVIEWSPGLVVFTFDGVEIRRTTDRIPNTPMHWVLQTETALSSTKPAASVQGDVQIDWVAAWQYDPSAKAPVSSTPTTSTTSTTSTSTTSTVAGDLIGPSVGIVSPVTGSRVSGAVVLTATATDPAGVNGARWYVDGIEAGWSSVAPWTTTLDTTRLAAGMHSIFVKARDGLGNWSTAKTVTIDVAPLAPTTVAPTTVPPTTVLPTTTVPPTTIPPTTIATTTVPPTTTAAVADARNIILDTQVQDPWSGLVTLAAHGGGVSALTAVKWYVDGVEVAYDGDGAPWTDVLDSSKLADGLHSVFVKARDTLGSWTTSRSVVIVIDN